MVKASFFIFLMLVARVLVAETAAENIVAMNNWTNVLLAQMAANNSVALANIQAGVAMRNTDATVQMNRENQLFSWLQNQMLYSQSERSRRDKLALDRDERLMKYNLEMQKIYTEMQAQALQTQRSMIDLYTKMVQAGYATPGRNTFDSGRGALSTTPLLPAQSAAQGEWHDPAMRRNGPGVYGGHHLQLSR